MGDSVKRFLLLLIFGVCGTVVQANNSNLHPVAQQESNPDRSWFYDGETVVFSSSSSYDFDGYVQARKWYINGSQVSTSTNYSRCFILDGSSGSGCYQLSSGVTTVTIKLDVQDNSGDWDSETIVYEVKDYKKRKYFIKDHLGSVRTTVDIDGNVLGYDDYYPFGLSMPNRSENTSNPNDNYKFTGYENDEEAGLITQHAGARRYDPIIGRFLSIDRFYDKYPSMSPYQYAAKNPVNFIDVNGDSIWVSKDKEGNLTLHYQGKIINNSDKKIDLEKATEEISNSIKKTYGGKITYNGEEVDLNVEVDLSVAESEDDISSSDHVLNIVDLGTRSDGVPLGYTQLYGDKVSLLSPDNFRSDYNPFSLFGAVSNNRTVVHEIGHQLGLQDRRLGAQPGRNLMNSGPGLRGNKLEPEQKTRAILNYTRGFLNRGNNKRRIIVR